MNVVRTATTPLAMRRLGRELGKTAVPGTLICLYGDLGAGKTTLTKGIAEGMGLPAREICSASFVLCAEHLEGRLPLYHVDLYRLDEAEVESSGLTDYFSTAGVTVVEWAERAAGLLPKRRIDVHIRIRGRSRDLSVSIPKGYGASGTVPAPEGEDLAVAGR